MWQLYLFQSMVFKMDLFWWIRTSKLAACDREGLWDRHVSLQKQKTLGGSSPRTERDVSGLWWSLGSLLFDKRVEYGP